MSVTTVKLQRGDPSQPWGFRIHGGVDFSQPLIILKVTAGSLSAQQGLVPGDQILQINGQDALSLRHREAQQMIISAGNQVDVEVLRGDSANLERVLTNEASGSLNIQSLKQSSSSSTTTTTTVESASSTSALASIIQSSSQVSTAAVSQGWRGPKYSEESIAESLTNQASVLQTGAIGVNFMREKAKKLDLDKSEVLKMLKDIETNQGQPPTTAGPLSPSAAGLISRAYDFANQALEQQHQQGQQYAQQLSPMPRTATPVQ